jgi:sigma-B regulation protein RsbU (phosphoserine phosphatase)
MTRPSVSHLRSHGGGGASTPGRTDRRPAPRPQSKPFSAWRRQFLSIRFQLLLAVNAILALSLSAFLVLDYRSEMAERLQDQHVGMEEEAKILLPAVKRLRQQGWEAVQEYLDAACGRMRESQSPGHHIAVSSDGMVLQAMAHHRSSPQILAAMEVGAASPDHRAKLGDEELVVGSHHEGAVTVYVSEYLSNLRHSVLGHIIRRLGASLLMGLLVAAVINVVLLRLIARPLDRLVGTVKQIARGHLGVQAGSFNSTELSCLAGAIDAMSSSLAKADRERRAQMAKARRIQDNLLPPAGNAPGLRMARLYRPAWDVAGDYFDALLLPDQTWLFCVADVTGHGVSAALGAVVLKALFLEAVKFHARPGEILSFINERFAAMCLPEDFASMLVALWNPAAACLEYASAGHEPAYCLAAGGTLHELSSTGPLIGIGLNSTWEMGTLPIGRGDRLLLLTDGIAEASGADGRPFGRERVSRLLGGCRDISLDEVVRRVEKALAEHRAGEQAEDDVTLLAIEFTDEWLQRKNATSRRASPSRLSAFGET